MSKHTPGPFRARKLRYGDYVIETELMCMNGLRAWFAVAHVHARDDCEILMSEGALADAKTDAEAICDALNAPARPEGDER